VASKNSDTKLCLTSLDDIESYEDCSSDGSQQYFVSSAAANTLLVGTLSESADWQNGILMADGCDSNAVIDFTSLESPSKVSDTVTKLIYSAEIWNNLSDTVKNSPSLTTFKTRLKSSPFNLVSKY